MTSGGMMNNEHGAMNQNHGMMAENHAAGMGETKGANKWWTLPVARMHVRGKGPATTHFGNNVKLMPGSYEVKVSVNGKVAMFHFSL